MISTVNVTLSPQTVADNEVYVKPSTQLNFDGPLLCGVTTDLIRNAVSLSAALDKVTICVYVCMCCSLCPLVGVHCMLQCVLNQGRPVCK